MSMSVVGTLLNAADRRHVNLRAVPPTWMRSGPPKEGPEARASAVAGGAGAARRRGTYLLAVLLVPLDLQRLLSLHLPAGHGLRRRLPLDRLVGRPRGRDAVGGGALGSRVARRVGAGRDGAEGQGAGRDD